MTVEILSYEDALSTLLGWVGALVNVTITPDFDGAMQVAGMGGLLQRGAPPPEILKEATGHQDEILFFYVGDDVDWQRRWFALTRAHFVSAFMYPTLTNGPDMLVLRQRLVNLAVAPLEIPTR